jgi:hypothetical protein
MKIENGKFCPLIKKDCMGLQCSWMIQVRGTNPQTGAEIDEWDCSIKWLPMLLIENANQMRQGAAATESFRNEMVKANEAAFHALPRLLSPNNDMRLINATDNH